MFPYLKFVSDSVPPNVAVSPVCFLENESSGAIPPQPRGPERRGQAHSSENVALEPATAAISSYSWVSVGLAGMLLILCWHCCSHCAACWNRRAGICVFEMDKDLVRWPAQETEEDNRPEMVKGVRGRL